MTFQTFIGLASVLLLIAGVGVWSGRKVKDGSDFITGGGRAGPWLVCGALTGGLVSSQSTIGSVQLAFHYGLSAWWFTLGSSLGCMLLALGYSRSLRASGCVTEIQIISREYGGSVETAGAVLSAAGIFITALSQHIASIGLLTLMFPSLAPWEAACVTAALMGCYVIFGGAWGAGMGGVLKVLLLYVSMMTAGAAVLWQEGGLSGLAESLNAMLAGTPIGMVQEPANGIANIISPADIPQRFGNFFARGFFKDAGSCISCMIGVMSTQTYAQAVWSAKTDKDAKRGVLLSAMLIPPLGAAGVLVGLAMRAHCITQAELSALTAAESFIPDAKVLASSLHVMPSFALERLPQFAAGIVLGTLIITSVAGGAGLTLGMSTIILKNILKRIIKNIDTAARELRAARLTTGALLASAAVIAAIMPNAMLNDLGFVSMGLRGVVVFAPMTCAMAFKGRVRPMFIMASIVIGAAIVLFGRGFLPFDPLMSGMAASILICAAGVIAGGRQH